MKKNLLKFIKPSPNSVFNCYNCKGIKYFTRLRLGLSHLREHKFKHSFQNTLNPFCSRSLDVETNTHFLLYCPLVSVIEDAPSWAQLMILIALWQMRIIQYRLIFFSLVKLFKIYQQIPTYNYDRTVWSKFVLVFCTFHLNVLSL